MNFLVQLTNSGTVVSKIINANSWSSCLAYCEGTGLEINIINYLSPNTNVVVNDPSSENCYNVSLKSNITNTFTNYFVFATDFSSIETWIGQQEDVTVTGVILSQKSYLTV